VRLCGLFEGKSRARANPGQAALAARLLVASAARYLVGQFRDIVALQSHKSQTHRGDRHPAAEVWIG
jgi:uncharacterized PurR-regulated membrane protein YhhQ (DUF165 family)